MTTPKLLHAVCRGLSMELYTLRVIDGDKSVYYIMENYWLDPTAPTEIALRLLSTEIDARMWEEHRAKWDPYDGHYVLEENEWASVTAPRDCNPADPDDVARAKIMAYGEMLGVGT